MSKILFNLYISVQTDQIHIRMQTAPVHVRVTGLIKLKAAKRIQELTRGENGEKVQGGGEVFGEQFLCD